MKKYVFFTVLGIFIFPNVGLAAFNRNLYLGLRNDPEVSQLQEFLAKQGVYNGPVTGNFLSLTRDGVRKFQEREKITPALGYFGFKTRAKASELLRKNEVGVDTPKAAIIKQVESLQRQLKELEVKKTEGKTVATTTIAISAPSVVFTKAPYIKSSGFVSGSSFGARYPYEVVFDWGTDKVALEEQVSCSPEIKNFNSKGRPAKYYPESNTTYRCLVEVKDSAGKAVSGEMSFTTPNWVNTATVLANPFPAVETNPYKFGEFSIYNGTTTSVLFANIETILSDGMDSASNRNRKVYFFVREGSSDTGLLISKTEFTFITDQPQLGSPHKSVLILPLDVLIKPGEEKKFSLWVEQFKYVKSGTLKIESTKIVTSSGNTEIKGGFGFILTREPPL